MTDEKRGDRRSETAKKHDDSELLDEALESPDKVGRAGGSLQRDIATAHPEKTIRDPDSRDRLTKEQELAHGSSSQSDKNRRT